MILRDESAAGRQAERIQRALSRPSISMRCGLRGRRRSGIALFPRDAQSIDVLLQRADIGDVPGTNERSR